MILTAPESSDTYRVVLSALLGTQQHQGEAVLVNDQPGIATLQLRQQGTLVVVLDVTEGSPLAQGDDRIQQIIRRQKQIAMPVHFIAVGGSEEVRQILKQQNPFIQIVPMGFYHVDTQGRSLHVTGKKSQLLERLLANLSHVQPISPDELQHRLVEAHGMHQEQTRLVAKIRRSFHASAATIAACVLVHAMAYYFADGDFNDALWRMGADNGRLVKAGEVWRLLSSAFLHGSHLHLGVNMYALWVLGPFLQAVVGRRRWIILYTLSALGGSLASSMLRPDILSVGASGAIWGLMAASLGLVLRPQGLLPPMAVAQMRTRIWMPVVINLVYSFQPGIDLFAHLGGGVTGLLLIVSGALTKGLSPVHAQELTERPQTRSNPLMTLGAVVCVLAMVASIAMAIFTGRPWELRNPPPLEPIPLGQTGLSLSLPPPLAKSAQQEIQGTLQIWSFGRIQGDPLLVEMVVNPLEAPVSPDQLDQALEQERLAMDQHGPPGATRVGASHLEQLGPHKVVVVDHKLPTDDKTKEVRIQAWAMFVGANEIVLRIYSKPDQPKAWRDLAPTIVASIKQQAGR